MVAVDHLEAGGLELLEVFGTGESVAVVEDLVAVFASVGDALLLLLVVAAPGREPDADAGFVSRGGRAGCGESVGEAGVEAP